CGTRSVHSRTASDDTWTWNGSDWTQQAAAGLPSPRSSMGMTYDRARGHVVLLGRGPTNLDYGYDDTWAWDGTDWTQFFPAHSPGRRYDIALADDVVPGRVLFYAGRDGIGGDTWVWDGTDWTQLPVGSVQLSPQRGAPG